MSRLCYPYGAGISCTCSASKRILSCVPVMDSVAGQERFYDTEDVMAVAGQDSGQETVEAGGEHLPPLLKSMLMYSPGLRGSEGSGCSLMHGKVLRDSRASRVGPEAS